MKFTTLCVRNFLSIGELELNLDNRGLVLICGKNLDNPSLNNNGSGKSSILESIIYVLYGKTLRGLSGDSIVNQKSEKNTVVSLDLIDDDGSSFRIVRYRKHSKYKNRFFLYHNDIDVTPKSETDFNQYISNLLQADYATFVASILYSTESFKFAMATDSEIKKIFDTMLGLDILSKSLDITKQQLREFNSKCSLITTKIENLEKKMEDISESIRKTQLDRLQFETSKSSKLENIKNTLEKITSESKSILDELDSLEESVNLQKKKVYDSKEAVLEKKQFELKQKISSLENQISKEEQSIEFFQKLMEQSANNILSITNQIKEIKLKQRNLVKCPVCNQPLPESKAKELSKNLTTQIEELNRQYYECEDQIIQNQSNIQKAQQSIDTYSNQIKELTTQLEYSSKFVKNYSSLESSLDKLSEIFNDENRKLTELHSNIKIKNVEYAKNTEMINTLSQNLKDLEESKNPY